METKEIKIEVPQGYEIDHQKSTFEKIIFKKIPENPKTWEEYCSLMEGKTIHYPDYYYIILRSFEDAYNMFATEERAKQFIAFGKLLQLHDYWVGDWKRNSDNIYIIFKNVIIATMNNNDFPLSFPTREMAERFKEYFKDLIKEAYPLV